MKRRARSFFLHEATRQDRAVVVRIKQPELAMSSGGSWNSSGPGEHSESGLIVSAETTDDLREIAYAILDGAAKLDKEKVT